MAQGKYRQVASATADSAGRCTIVFPSGAMGSIITAGLTIYTSPPAIPWLIQINAAPSSPGTGQTIDTTVGSATASGLQILGNETLSAFASGLLPGVTISALLDGVIDDEANVPFQPPAPDSTVAITVGGAGGPVLAITNVTLPAVSSFATLPVAVPVVTSLALVVITTTGAAPCIVNATWAQDAVPGLGAHTVSVGNDWGEGIGPATHYVPLVPLAPYIDFLFQTLTGGAGGVVTVAMMPMPASGPPALVVPTSTVIDTQGAAIGAGVTSVFNPNNYTYGRYHLWATVNQTFTVAVQRFNPNTVAFDPISQPVAGAASGVIEYDFAAPIDSWRIAVHNTSVTAGTVSLAVTGPY